MPAETRDRPSGTRLTDQLTNFADWVREHSGRPVRLDATADPSGDLRVEVVQLTWSDRSPEPGAHRIDALVLISCQGTDPVGDAATISELMLDVLDDGRWRLGTGTLPESHWATPGRNARPHFTVIIPVQRPQPTRTTTLVRHLDTQSAALCRAHGRVLAADGTPLPGATVRLLGRPPVTTDFRGRWNLTVPSHPVRLEIGARGRRVQQVLDPDDRSDIDIVIADLGGTPTTTTRTES